MDANLPDPRTRRTRALAYLKARVPWVIASMWFGGSVLLASFNIVDVTLPCLFSALFELRCPGCGTTTALISLVQLDVARAMKTNPLVFIVFPGLVYCAFRDWRRFSLT